MTLPVVEPGQEGHLTVRFETGPGHRVGRAGSRRRLGPAGRAGLATSRIAVTGRRPIGPVERPRDRCRSGASDGRAAGRRCRRRPPAGSRPWAGTATSCWPQGRAGRAVAGPDRQRRLQAAWTPIEPQVLDAGGRGDSTPCSAPSAGAQVARPDPTARCAWSPDPRADRHRPRRWSSPIARSLTVHPDRRAALRRDGHRAAPSVDDLPRVGVGLALVAGFEPLRVARPRARRELRRPPGRRRSWVAGPDRSPTSTCPTSCPRSTAATPTPGGWRCEHADGLGVLVAGPRIPPPAVLGQPLHGPTTSTGPPT